jgi:hypothetical protein
MRPIDIAKKAWKMPEGFHKIGNHHVYRDKKMCAVGEPNTSNAMSQRINEIVVFPKEEHLDPFMQATAGVQAYGPAQWNPGAVGTVEIDPGDFHGIRVFQTHYKSTPSAKQVKIDMGRMPPGSLLPRSLATRYAGWKDRATQLALRMAEEDGKELAVLHTAFKPPNVAGRPKKEPKDTTTFKQLTRFCNRHGLSLIEAEPGGPEHRFAIRKKDI